VFCFGIHSGLLPDLLFAYVTLSAGSMEGTFFADCSSFCYLCRTERAKDLTAFPRRCWARWALTCCQRASFPGFAAKRNTCCFLFGDAALLYYPATYICWRVRPSIVARQLMFARWCGAGWTRWRTAAAMAPPRSRGDCGEPRPSPSLSRVIPVAWLQWTVSCAVLPLQRRVRTATTWRVSTALGRFFVSGFRRAAGLFAVPGIFSLLPSCTYACARVAWISIYALVRLCLALSLSVLADTYSPLVRVHCFFSTARLRSHASACAICSLHTLHQLTSAYTMLYARGAWVLPFCSRMAMPTRLYYRCYTDAEQHTIIAPATFRRTVADGAVCSAWRRCSACNRL